MSIGRAMRIECLFFPAENEDTGRWYEEYLGLAKDGVSYNFPEGGPCLIFVNSSDKLGIQEHNGPLVQPVTIYVDDIEAMHEKIKGSGVYLGDIEDNGGCGRQFECFDPSGTKLMLNEPQTVLRLRHVETVDQFQAELRRKLLLSEDYKDDWESFDRLADLNRLPRRFVLDGWESIRDQLPVHADELNHRLQEYNRDHPVNALRVIFYS